MQHPATAFAIWFVLQFKQFAAAFNVENQYHPGERVTLWLNMLGPIGNPQEAYDCPRLPACGSGESNAHSFPFSTQRTSLGDAILGNRLVDSGLQFNFRVDQRARVICQGKLQESDAVALADAVAQRYHYDMYLDDLQMWAFMGEEVHGKPGSAAAAAGLRSEGEAGAGDGNDVVAPPRLLLFTHLAFEVYFNSNRIVEATVKAQEPIAIAPGANATISYQVTWRSTQRSYGARLHRYLDRDFYEQPLHLSSVLNGALGLAAAALLAAVVLVRTLRRDVGCDGSGGGDFDTGTAACSGWRRLSAEAGLPPPAPLALAAIVASGTHLACLVLCASAATAQGMLWRERGLVIAVFVNACIVTAPCAGFCGAFAYSRLGGARPAHAAVAAAAALPVFLAVIALGLNAATGGLGARPVLGGRATVALLSRWLLACLPLHLFGAAAGRYIAGPPPPPPPRPDRPPLARTLTFRAPRPPPRPLTVLRLLRHAAIILAGGLIPFGCIFVELYFTYGALWHFKIYYLYHYMLISLSILLATSACVAVVATFATLANECAAWHWVAAATPATTGLYCLAFSAHYFMTHTEITGTPQTWVFFGYAVVVSAAVSAIAAAAGYGASALYVSQLYRMTKRE